MVYTKKIHIAKSRKEFRRQNNFYEFNRVSFYRRLHEDIKPPGIQTDEDMVRFWNDIRNKSTAEKVEDYSEVIETKPLQFEANEGIIDIETKMKMISSLPNWKTPGPDRIYNFFIKNCYPLQKYIAINVKK